MRVRATGDRHPLTGKIVDRIDAGVRPRDERGPFRLRIDVDGPDRIAVGAAQQRCDARRRTEVDGDGVQKLQGLVASAGPPTLHMDVLTGQPHPAPTLCPPTTVSRDLMYK